jgi:hypothetical protein
MKRLFVASVVVFGFASPALASHCPKDAKLVAAALANQSNAEAEQLAAKGMKLHEEGKHKESLDALHEAMKLLGIEH